MPNAHRYASNHGCFGNPTLTPGGFPFIDLPKDEPSRRRTKRVKPDPTQEDVAFLAAMLDLTRNGHATASEYERLQRLSEPYLAARFKEEGGDDASE